MLSPKEQNIESIIGRMRGTKTRGNEICFGSYGLQALEPTWITSRQIEASRRAITATQNVELHGLEFFLIRR
jgi:large subunit ribosomal protein L16